MNNKKNLPIRIFHKREIDSRETEGGGSKKPLKWFLSGEELKEHSIKRIEEIEKIEELMPSEDGYFEIPQAVCIDIHKDAFAKTHRESIELIFSEKSKNLDSLCFTQENDLLFPISTKKQLFNAKNKFINPEKNIKTVSAIKKIKKFTPHVSKNLSIEENLKIKFINFKDKLIQNKVHDKFEKYCHRKNISFKKCSYAQSLKIYKVGNVSKDSLKGIIGLDGVFSIESMPQYEISPDCIGLKKSVSVKEPDPSKNYPTIGILDSGIEKIDHLSPWIIDSHSPYIEEELDKSHGTFVAGLVCYGSEFLSCVEDPKSPCNIFDAAVISDDKLGKIEEAELIDNIREVIGMKSNSIKIWSLSLGTKKESSLDYFSDFGTTLDEIQDKESVLIIKSAGNCYNFTENKPVSRISESADSIRSLVVGSIAHDKYETDISEVDSHSPFSRIGPGPQGIVKPELVYYGGNSGLSEEGVMLENGIPSFTISGDVGKMCGTSFSTPQVSSILADINNNLNGSFDSNLLKNLAIHNAQYPNTIKEKGNEKINRYGFGLASSVDDVLFNNENEITLILQDKLPRGQWVEILDFPFPQNLIDENGYYCGEIIVTVVNKGPLDGTQGREYCQSNLEISLGTYDSTKERDVKKPQIKNPVGKVNAMNILNSSLYSKKIKKGLKESYLIKDGKYHPIKKFHCDLDKITQANKKYIESPKKWYLSIKGQFRKNIERLSDLYGSELLNEFCISITIKDKEKKERIYNEVVQLLNNNNFIHQQIDLREDVRVYQNL